MKAAKQPTDPRDIPRDEVMELRWLQDRIRLVQLESQASVQQIQARIAEITNGWKARYEIEDLSEYELHECELVHRKASVDGSNLGAG